MLDKILGTMAEMEGAGRALTVAKMQELLTEAGWTRCNNCGHHVEHVCPSCGECPDCGHSVMCENQ